MTTTTVPTTLTGPPAAVHLSFSRVVASEWRKLTSLRSTWWTLGALVVLQTGVAALLGMVARTISRQTDASAQQGLGLDATQIASAGLQFSQLTVVALAVLTITAEYSSGQIRVSMTAVPHRLPVLWAKLLVTGLVVLVVGSVATGLSVGVAKLIGGDQVKFTFSGAETARVLAGAPLYLVGIVAISLGLGAIMRHTAGAMATLMGFLLVVETVFAAIPWKPLELISPWLPSRAGQALMSSQAHIDALRVADHVGAVLDPWAGYAVMLGWGVLLLAVGAVLLRARDV